VEGLEVANFKATLPYQSLGTGATSKASDSGQTGQHGEGMKLSALLFRHSDYNFRIESGEFKWNFIFKKGELACDLRRMGQKTIHSQRQKAKGHPRTDVALP
jgi:beta-glucosidase